MPYTRKRRAAFRRKGVTRKRVTKIVKKAINNNLETKWSDGGIVNTDAASTWQFQTLCPLSQGTTANTRIGNKVKLKKIQVHVWIRPKSGSSIDAAGSMCRAVLYHNREAVGSLPAASAVFDGATPAWNAMRNIAQTDRIKILRDYTHAMVVTSNNAGVVYSGGPAAYFVWTIYPKTTLHYTANAGDITDLLMDDYGVGFCADDNLCCTVTMQSQIFFTDS